jgi:hypothetical protein
MTMQIPIADGREHLRRSKLIGSKPALRTNNVWSIRTKLHVGRRIRDLAMFNFDLGRELGPIKH